MKTRMIYWIYTVWLLGNSCRAEVSDLRSADASGASESSETSAKSKAVQEKKDPQTTGSADAEGRLPGAGTETPGSDAKNQATAVNKSEANGSSGNGTMGGGSGVPANNGPAPVAPASTPANPSTSPKPATGIGSVVTAQFYPIKGIRPKSVCGKEGFAYLWQGYFVPECGGCHYLGNIYKQKEFAQRNDQDASFAAMLEENADAIMRAADGQVFCTKCILKPADPLRADIKFWLANREQCPP